MHRRLDWDGCFNVRDLGGLRTLNGCTTRFNRMVRADNAAKLTAGGWEALQSHGVRTIIDLRDDGERCSESPCHSMHVERVALPIEDLENRAFWKQWTKLNCTPLYYRAFLESSPDRIVSVLARMANAGPGGILFHCGRGRDRTGLVSILLLALVQVEPDEIVGDYELSQDSLEVQGLTDERTKIEELLAKHNTTCRDSILELLSEIEIEAYLRDSGLADSDIECLRSRLVGD